MLPPPWLFLALATLIGLHLLVVVRISQYHQRVLKVKSGTWLFPVSLGVVSAAAAAALLLPGHLGTYTFHLTAGLCLGLAGVHLAHTMLVK